MNARKTVYLMSTALVAGGLVAGPLPRAIAQSAAAQSAQQSDEADPPALVGRLAFTQGTVSFRTGEQTQWQPATLNYPVTSGTAFWTEPQALAGIEVASSRIWMNGATELDVTTLNDQAMAAAEPQGELYLHIDHLMNGQTYTIETPRGVVTLTRDGQYEVVAGDTEHPTAVTVVDGAAQVTSNNLSLQVGPRQTATLTGTDTFHGDVGTLAQDNFLNAMMARERQQLAATHPSQGSPPPVVSQMTGYQALQQYGTWQSTPQYGSVWYPQQAGSDWTPYQDGSWSYVAPWGWTWVSAEPWGFAPFHYGRWADIDGRWGWVPGGGPGRGERFERPVYAPALVAFFWLGAEKERREVGWVPLGPGEAYYPPYRVGDRYLRAVNRFDVRNDAELRRDRRADEIAIDRFVNRRAAVVVPATVMVESRLLRGTVQRLGPERLAEVHPLIGRRPLEPTVATAGVTPRVARELRLEGELRQRGPEAPGPRIEAMEFGHPRGPGERHALPPLRQANVHSGAPVPMERARPETAGEAERRPGEIGPGGLPSLRPPNARPGEHGEHGPKAMLPGEARPREGERVPGAPGQRGPNAMLPGEARPHEGERVPGAPGERRPNAMLPGGAEPHRGERVPGAPGERGPNAMLPGEARPHEGERVPGAPGERGPNAMLPGGAEPHEGRQVPSAPGERGPNAMLPGEVRPHGGERVPGAPGEHGPNAMLPGEVQPPHEGRLGPGAPGERGPNAMLPHEVRPHEGERVPGTPGERSPNTLHPGEARPHEGERTRGGILPNASVPQRLPGQPGMQPRHEAFAEPPMHGPRQPPEPPAFRPMPPPHMSAPVAMARPMPPRPQFTPPPAHFVRPAQHFAPPPVMHVATPAPHRAPPPRRDEH